MNKTKLILIIFFAIVVFSGFVLYYVKHKETIVKDEYSQGRVDDSSFFLREVSDKEILTNAVRPDVVEIGGKLYLAYKNLTSPQDDGFKAVVLDDNLNIIKTSTSIAPEDESTMVTDIRVATDDQNNFWYAYESVFGSAGCGNHLVNGALYDKNIVLKSSKAKLSTGCTSGPQRLNIPTSQIPKNPEIADDPTPFFYKGRYYILSRAWDGPVNHMRVYDQKFNKLDYFTLDISGMFKQNEGLSQNAMVEIEGGVYVVGGIQSGPPVGENSSYIVAIPLNGNLKIDSKYTKLTSYKEYDTRVTSAKYGKGVLYVNYHDLKNKFQYLEAFDVKNNFASLGRVKFQDGIVGDGHSSFDIIGSKIYLFYVDTNNSVKAKVIEIGDKGGQIEVKTTKSTQDESFVNMQEGQNGLGSTTQSVSGQRPALSKELEAKIKCADDCVKSEGKTFDACATKCGLPPPPNK